MLSVDLQPDHFPEMPLGKSLQAVLKPIGLKVGVDGEALRVAPPNDEHPPPITRVYDVRILLSRQEDEQLPRALPEQYMASAAPVAGSPANGSPLPAPIRCGTFGFQQVSKDGFADFVMRNVAPETWERAGGGGVLDMYHGLLVATNTWEVHHQLRQCVEDLYRALASLRPDSVPADSTPAEDLETAVGLILNSQSDYVSAFGVLLFEESDFPAALAVPAIVKRLRATDPEAAADARRPLFEILRDYGPQAAEVAPILAEQLPSIEDTAQRCIVIETLGFIGEAAGPALAGYLHSNFDRVARNHAERKQLIEALATAGEGSVEALEPLLRLLAGASDREEQRRLADSLVEIDPDGNRCREIASRWKESEDEQTHQRGYRAQAQVRAVFGDPY
jgi:hypothetical protein